MQAIFKYVNKKEELLALFLVLSLFAFLSYFDLDNITGRQVANMGTLTIEKFGTCNGFINSNPEGLNCDETKCIGTFPLGTYINLSAVPDTSQGENCFFIDFYLEDNSVCGKYDEFGYWVNKCDVLINEPTVIKAKFEYSTWGIPFYEGGVWGGAGTGEA